MTVPRRRVAQRGRLHMGEARWLLGATPHWDYHQGGCSHGSIVRWKFLFLRKCTLEDWEEFQQQYWEQWRNSIIAWHLARGWKAPPPHLRGHKAERQWLWNERRHRPRARLR